VAIFLYHVIGPLPTSYIYNGIAEAGHLYLLAEGDSLVVKVTACPFEF